jgi:hypothetical protein
MNSDAGGWLWLLIDVAFVVILMAYALSQPSRRAHS